MLIIVLLATASLIFWDTHRGKKGSIGKIIKQINKSLMLDQILKPHESKGKLTGATLMMVSGLLCMMVFPKDVFIISFTVLVISDSAANYFGSKYGRPTNVTDKSLVGSQAFAISSFVISSILGELYSLPFLPLAIASVTAAYFEHCSNVIKIDDNFIVPISFSMSFVISSAILY